MKIYNYHLQKRDIPVMMKPNEDEGRFTKIIYFKDNPKTQVPRTLSVYGEKKEIYGYGFFNKFYPLEPQYIDERPSYLPYDPYTRKLSTKNYDLIKTNSYIRVENEDFSDFKKDRPYIFIADHNFCYLDNSYDFLREYKNYNFNFMHKLEVKDEETFKKIIPYASLFNRNIFVNYKFSESLFKQYYNEAVVFNWNNPFENESKEQYANRIISMLLYYKINNVIPRITYAETGDPFLNSILDWRKDKSGKSYYEFYKDNKQMVKNVEAAAAQQRLLLKSSPKKMKSSDISFKGLLAN